MPGATRPGFDTGTGNAPGVAPVIEYQFADALGYCPAGASGFAPGVTVPHPYQRYAGGPAYTGSPLTPVPRNGVVAVGSGCMIGCGCAFADGCLSLLPRPISRSSIFGCADCAVGSPLIE